MQSRPTKRRAVEARPGQVRSVQDCDGESRAGQHCTSEIRFHHRRAVQDRIGQQGIGAVRPKQPRLGEIRLVHPGTAPASPTCQRVSPLSTMSRVCTSEEDWLGTSLSRFGAAAALWRVWLAVPGKAGDARPLRI